jgi:hypothetical protein
MDALGGLPHWPLRSHRADRCLADNAANLPERQITKIQLKKLNERVW